MFVFSSTNFCAIFVNLLTISKVFASHSSIPPPKRSGDYGAAGFTNFVKRLEDEFLGVPAKKVHADSQQPAQMTVFRLPTHIRPRSYALKMVVDREKSAFSGEVRINVSVSQNSDSVLLHSHRLKIGEVALYHNNTRTSTSFALDPANQLVRIRTKSTLQKNEFYQIEVKFGGKLNAEFEGFYRSASSVGNTIKHIAVTQFEPTQAREAFPCFDEPHFRATFDIRVARYQNEIALSNMPLVSASTPDPSVDNRVWNTFDTTPPMPTYLVAFAIVEDFANISDPTGKYKFWAAKDEIEECGYAQTTLEKAVKFAEVYTGIEYALPQLNALVVEDFLKAAMENWGLMVFRTKLVKFKDNEDNSWSQHQVLLLVVHEVMHQWFGNFVTIEWWDSLWLKEGLATLLSYVIGALVDPRWRLADLFLHEIKINALEFDGATDTNAMTHPVNTPAEIDVQFNTVAYEKAASVLHMLRFMVSPTTFRKALHMYLHTGHEAGGGVTSPDDLWAAFDKQLFSENRSLENGLTVGQTMRSWTHQARYPIIMVSRYNKGSRDDIGFKQEAFDPSNAAGLGDATQVWTVPLTCTKGSNPDFDDTRPKLWLLDKKEVILPNEVGKDEWIVCNVQQTGYYRLNYDETSWGLIADVLQSSPEQIHPYNRHQIMYDVFTMLRTRRMSYRSALRIIYSLDRENNALAWQTIIPLVDGLLWQFEGTKAYEGLKRFFQKRLQQIYGKVGFHERSTDAQDVKKFRPQLLRTVCELGNSDCLLKAAAEFDKHDTIDSLPSYSQYAAICTALIVNSSSDLTWKKLRHYFKRHVKPQDDQDLASSFRSLKDESTIKKFLTDLSEGKANELQKYSLGIALNQYHGMIAAMHFIQEMLPKISQYRTGETVIQTILNSISVRSDEQVNLINKMLETAIRLDSKKYENIIKMLDDKKREAESKVKGLDELSSQIQAALDSFRPELVSDTEFPTVSSLKTSTATYSFSGCLIFTCISWFLSVTLARLNGN